MQNAIALVFNSKADYGKMLSGQSFTAIAIDSDGTQYELYCMVRRAIAAPVKQVEVIECSENLDP